MARRAKRRADAPPKSAAKPGPLNAPFAGLKQRLRTTAPPPAPAARPAPPPPAPVVDDTDLLARALEGVVPLRSRTRVDAPAPAETPRPRVSEEAEALAVLADVVSGQAAFDVTDTREYVEGAVVGLDPRLVRRLRRGDFARQAHLDLHGMIADEARPAVDRFLSESFRQGLRCVLIVHGRGHNSKDRTPVLKEKLKSWLARGRAATLVLAFATARPNDGGAGALYVLLRRDRRRSPIRVTDGTTT